MKICKRCNKIKDLSDFRWKKNGGKKYKIGKLYQSKTCKSCENDLWNKSEIKRKQSAEYIERQKIKLLNWRKNNKDKVKELHRQYVQLSKFKNWFSNYRKLRYSNPEIRQQVKFTARKTCKKSIDAITETYARRQLKHQKPDLIVTEDMIRIKQVEIAMYRINKLIKLLEKNEQQD